MKKQIKLTKEKFTLRSEPNGYKGKGMTYKEKLEKSINQRKFREFEEILNNDGYIIRVKK
ncbi:hypothetical protein FOLKNPGA_03371 [Legionella sp. PC1000]|uniref:hypothetical protein n=1 Tax=Legionella sp. PC1000 TaxID=2746060 RepID=UPI0015F8154B|nr:hypothetical protein [Legionella sp. PC1000]QLZ70557.1 hypothetical protein FOLKNPGA_03371 [Legionella sp. PC1000]